jgi:tetratricopeptide (TPR) repeat protein
MRALVTWSVTGDAGKQRADRERNDVVMKPKRGAPSASDRRLSRVLRLGVAVFVVGVLAFAYIYYQDQYAVSAGPSMIDRQTTSAEQAVKKTPNNIGARLELASAYRLSKRYSDELTQYDEILKADKTNRSALLGRGGALMAKGDLKAAAVAYHKIADATKKGEFSGADPQLEEARYYLGSIALTQGNTKEAITQLASALKITRSDSDALYLMGVAQYKAGSTQLAVDALKQALQFVPTGWCEPYTQLNLAYTKLGQAPQATYAGGMADFCNKKPAQAKARLKTLAGGPVQIDAWLALGLIAETESLNPEAVTWYQKVLTVDPKNAGAVASLSRLGVGPTPGPTSTSKK